MGAAEPAEAHRMPARNGPNSRASLHKVMAEVAEIFRGDSAMDSQSVAMDAWLSEWLVASGSDENSRTRPLWLRK